MNNPLVPGAVDYASIFVLAAVWLVVGAAVYVWTAFALSKLFPKLGSPAWKGWVPVVNIIEVLRHGGYSGWWALALAFPVVNVAGAVVLALCVHTITQRFGRGGGYTALGILLFPVWASILGFGAAQPTDAAAPDTLGARMASLQHPQPAPRLDASLAGFPPPAGPPTAAPPPERAPATSPIPERASVTTSFPERSAVPPPPPVPVVPRTSTRPVEPPVIPFSAAAVMQSSPVSAPASPPAPPESLPSPPPRPSFAATSEAVPQALVEPPTRSATPPPRPTTTPPPPLIEPVVSADGDPWAPPVRSIPGLAAAAAAPAPTPPPPPAAPPVVASPPVAPSPQVAASVPVAPTSAPAPSPHPVIAPSPAESSVPAAGSAPINDDFDETVVSARRTRAIWQLIPAAGEPIPLTAERVIIGRNPAVGVADDGAQIIAVADPSKTVSKTHARIELVGGEWRVTDLHSTNGVAVVTTDGEDIELASGGSAEILVTFKLGELALDIGPILS
jgi:hypothetical protein